MGLVEVSLCVFLSLPHLLSLETHSYCWFFWEDLFVFHAKWNAFAFRDEESNLLCKVPEEFLQRDFLLQTKYSASI